MPSPHQRFGDGSDDFSVSDAGGANVGARFDAFGRRRQSTSGKPVATAGAGAGTSPTIANTGTDEFGTLTVTAGTSPAAGTLATLAFVNAFATAPAVVIVSPADSASAAVGGYYASATTTTLTIGTHGTPAGTMKVNYQVVGGA